MSTSIKIRPIIESNDSNKCKLHVFHLPCSNTIKLNICDSLEFYSDVDLPFVIDPDSDIQSMINFFEMLCSNYRAKLSELNELIEKYNTESTEYSNDLIHNLFTLLRIVKQGRAHSIEFSAGLEKIIKEYNSTKLNEYFIDVTEIQSEFEILAEMVTDTVEMVSHLNENDTNNLMKKLTKYTLIFTPLNLLAGMGGMSEWSTFVAYAGLGGFWGYILFAILLIIIGISTSYYFRTK
jgi:Mg2+ and Co2+ transporter CorA